MASSEQRTGWLRRNDHGGVVVLDRGDGNQHAPQSEVAADGRWHHPAPYGEPLERLARNPAVHVAVEYDDHQRYRIAALNFDRCPRCGAQVLMMREWKPGTPRHAHRPMSTSIHSPEGDTVFSGVFCDECYEQLATDERRREALIKSADAK